MHFFITYAKHKYAIFLVLLNLYCRIHSDIIFPFFFNI